MHEPCPCERSSKVAAHTHAVAREAPSNTGSSGEGGRQLWRSASAEQGGARRGAGVGQSNGLMLMMWMCVMMMMIIDLHDRIIIGTAEEDEEAKENLEKKAEEEMDES